MEQHTILNRFRISQRFRTAFLAALIAGVLTHFFGLVNPIHNYDDVSVQPYGYGTGISSGRWFLSVMGEIAMHLDLAFNLPWVNGLVFLVLIAIAAGFLVSALQIRSRFFSGLIGALLAVFPTATSTLYFKFASPYYGVAILLAILAAWVVGRCKYSLVISALCTALSLGVYQAYTPMTIAIFVLILIRYALSGNADAKGIFQKGLLYCAALILGVLCYVILLKAMLLITGTHLSSYQNINQMGLISLAEFPYLVYTAFKTVLLLPFRDYHGLSCNPVLRIVYLLLALFSLACVVYTLAVKIRKTDIALLVGLLCLVFPIAVSFVIVMCPNSGMYTLMLYGFAILPCFPLAVLECLPREALHGKGKIWSIRLAGLLLSVLIFFYSYDANVSYMASYFANRQTENYFNSMVAQIRMTEGFTAEKKWVFIGNVDDPLLTSFWNWETRYGGNSNVNGLVNGYNKAAWLQNYLGYYIFLADEDTAYNMAQTEEVKAMPCWPDQGSIQVIGDSVVVKFQELAQ